jgi:hypothetical protein
LHRERWAEQYWLWALVVSFASVIVYWRAMTLPLISDDYLVLWLARSYGEPGGWAGLAGDALYRCRATFMVLTHFMDRWFGVDDFPYKVASLVVHVGSCLLVLALGTWKVIGWRLAVPAAVFFATHHGHQEAVIWYSAMPDQLALAFTLAAILAWVHGRPVLVWGFYALALLSKESGVALVGLLGLVMLADGQPWRRVLRQTAPMALVAVLYFAASFAARGDHLHFNDGTFSLSAPFPLVIGRSMARALWVTGWLSLGLLAWKRPTHLWRPAGFGLAWMALALLPYAFLTYMPVVPSRHAYLAGVGLSLVAAIGFTILREHLQLRAVVAIVAAVLAIKCGYLWTRKHEQFVKRAAPTEQLVEALKNHQGPVAVDCFPYPAQIAEAAVRLHLGQPRELKHSCPEGQSFRVSAD